MLLVNNDDFIGEVTERLEYLGVKNVDDTGVVFATREAEAYIKGVTNLEDFPEALDVVAVDIACGLYLLSAYRLGKLNMQGVNFANSITQVKEGDTSVSFGDSDVKRFSALCDDLIHGKRGELLRYRVLTW